MFSRIAHKVTKGDLKPATIENPSHVLIVNATTQVGLALTEELSRGKWNRMFKVTAAAIMNEKEQKMEKLKSFESKVLQFDPLKMLAVESYMRDNEVHVLVLTGSTSLDNIQMSKDWIDTAKKVVLMIQGNPNLIQRRALTTMSCFRLPRLIRATPRGRVNFKSLNDMSVPMHLFTRSFVHLSTLTILLGMQRKSRMKRRYLFLSKRCVSWKL